MGWFGKILGGTIGFAVGGPLGAAVGAALGHAADSRAEASQREEDLRRLALPEEELMATLRALEQARVWRRDLQLRLLEDLLAIMAKVAKSDGVISREEIPVLKKFMVEELGLDAPTMKHLVGVFRKAKSAWISVPELAEDIGALSAELRVPELPWNVLDIAFRVAWADGRLTEEEETLLERIAEALGIDDDRYEALRSQYVQNCSSAYRILGCRPEDPDEIIRARYRELAKRFHPDTLAGKELPKEFVEFAETRFHEIREAYEQVVSESKRA